MPSLTDKSLPQGKSIHHYYFYGGIDATMIDSYFMKMRMLPMESLMIIWCSIYAKFWTAPYVQLSSFITKISGSSRKCSNNLSALADE